MATAATSLLGLALPVTGELSGTWGDTVNVSITALLDTAVAGTTTLSSDADVTLTTTTLAANEARQAIILWTAGGTVTRTITAPAQSKSYIVINKTSSSQSIKIVGVGPTTGVTIVAGTAAFVVWNGVDFVTASVTSTTGVLPVANGGTGLTAGTSGGVLAYTATGTLASSAALAASALVIGGGAGAAPSTTTTGTGVVTALGVNTGTAGAFVVNGGALGSPSTAGTMPAFTLGGTVSGGGNNINNVVIGASGALAGNFTTLSATGLITQTATAATNTQAMLLTGATTGAHYIQMTNTSASAIVGVEGSAGGFLSTGGSPYALQLRNTTGRDVQIAPDGTVMSTFSSTGLAVTGTLSVTMNSALSFDATNIATWNYAGFANTTSGAFKNIGVLFSTESNGEVFIGAVENAGNTAADLVIATRSAGARAERLRLTSTGTLSGGTSGTAYSFSGSAPATSLTLDSSGNVGIGTSSPAYKLDVSTGSGTGIRLKSTGAYSTILTDNTGTTGGGSYAAYQNGVQITIFGVEGAILGNTSTNTAIFNDVVGGGIKLYTNASATPKAILDSAGIVTMTAYGAGAATFSSAGVISSVSDETWKIKDGVPVDTDAMLKKLEPGYWYYNDEKKETFGADRQLGFYAQNVNAAIGPEAAPTPQEGKPWGYYDRSVLAITVMSLQKALATIETLTARITALETA